MSPQTPFQLLGGEAAVRELADAFYDAMDALPDARDIRRMHADNLDEIKENKLYAIGPDERDQWPLCMDAALEKVGAGDEVKSMLKPAMFRVADAVRNLDHCNRQPRGDGIIAIG